MEQQSPPQVKILDRPQPSQITERLSKSLREDTIKRLRSVPPQAINTIHGNMHGDNMIHWWATSKVLLKLCQEADPPIQLTEDSLPITSGMPGGLDLFSRATEVVESNSSLAVSKNSSLSHQRMELLANALGVTLTQEELDSVPQPLKTDYPPFNNFDREKVLTRARELEEDQEGKYTVTIIQGGSSPWKRFENSHVEELIETVRQLFKNSRVTVITDYRSPNPRFLDIAAREREAPKFSADTTVDSTDINEVSAHLAKRTDLIISTDTFLSHLAAGCQEMAQHNSDNFTPAQMFVLFTLADPKIWGNNRITPVVSDFLANALEEGKSFYPGTEGVISPEPYIEMASEAQLKEMDLGFDDQRYDPQAISPLDIDALKEVIRTFKLSRIFI